MNNRDLSPLAFFESASHFWWAIVVISIIGGLLGWLFCWFQPPIYEASAMYSMDLDEQELAPADQLPLSYVAQNNYLAPVQSLFHAQDVRDKLLIDAKKNDIKLNAADFNGKDFRIERVGYLWRLVVSNTDPQAAAALANLWADTVYTTMTEISSHAVNVRRLELEVTVLQRCFSTNDFNQANLCAGTSFPTLGEVDTHLAGLDSQLLSERKASRDITSALSFAITEMASVPNEPVLYKRSMIIFAGTAIGLLIGFLLSPRLAFLLAKRNVKPKI